MKEEIGITAGKVWKALSEQGPADITHIVKLVKDKEVMVQRALGWLAREEKIVFEKKGNRTIISLVK